MHDAWLVAVPTLLILAGILPNNHSARDVRSEMKDVRSEMRDFRLESKAEMRELRTEVRSRFDQMDAELRYFHGAIGRLDAGLTQLKRELLR